MTLRSCLVLPVISLVSLLACAVNGQTQPSSCSLLTDIPSSCAPSPDCTGLVCNSLYGTVTLTIVKCSDPLAVELGLRPSGSTAVSRINYYVGYYVGGPEVVTDSSTIGQLTPLHAHFSRNTTHLNFTATGIHEGDIAVVLIPDVEFPLEPHTCMCQSMDDVSNNIMFPPAGQFQYSCYTGSNCSSVMCNVTAQQVTSSNELLSIDPCSELLIFNSTATGLGTDLIVFNETKSRLFSSLGFNFTVNVLLEHHNYSMDIQMDLIVAAVGLNFTIIPKNTIILDRSMCAGDLVYYLGTAGPTVLPQVTTPSDQPHVSTPGGPTTTEGQPPETTTTIVHPPETTTRVHPPETTIPTLPPFSCLLPVGCRPLTGCSGFTCYEHAFITNITVDKCSDPVTVDITVMPNASPSSVLFQGRYFVGGPEEIFYLTIDQFKNVTMKYNRNTTHLNINAFGITEGDVSQGEPSVTIVLIPDVEFSLEPHTCMCQSMDNLSNKIRFPGVEVGQLPYSCVTAPDCSGVMCNFTAQQATVLSTQFAVDPCSEVLVLNSRTAGTEKANSIMFNETEDRPFTGGGISVTVHVVLKHHNFSMDIQMVFEARSTTFTVIPMSKFILDRSMCAGNLLYYAGDQQPPIFPTTTTPPPPAGISGAAITAIAVIVTFCIVTSLVVIVIVIVIVTVVMKRRKRVSDSYSFRQLTDDDDDKGEPDM